jgi:hypothetical protein
MERERLLKIEEIHKGSSSRLRETYFVNNFQEVYLIIMDFTKEIDVPFIQRIWHWVNDLPTYFTCKCGNKTTFNRNWLDGYRIACSPKCAQSEESVKSKRKNTTKEKYGVDNIAKLDTIKEKTTNTNLSKYGTKSTFQNKEVRNKWKETIKEKYGVNHYFQSKEFKIQAKKHYLEKYGVEHQLQVEDIKERIKNTCLERYGVDTYLKTQHARDSIKSYNTSSYEYEIVEWLNSHNIKSVHGDNTTIYPLTLDIYIPSKSLAIEFNGLWWHSEYLREKDYHLKKTDMCKDKKIHLIHIWEIFLIVLSYR